MLYLLAQFYSGCSISSFYALFPSVLAKERIREQLDTLVLEDGAFAQSQYDQQQTHEAQGIHD